MGYRMEEYAEEYTDRKMHFLEVYWLLDQYYHNHGQSFVMKLYELLYVPAPI